MRCHSAWTLVWSQVTVLDRSPRSSRKGEIWESEPQFAAMPPNAKLLWPLFLLLDISIKLRIRTSYIVGFLTGVTQLHGTVYVIRDYFSGVLRFNATTRQQLKDINVKHLSRPTDIVACEQTSQVYVADRECVWRMSADGEDTKRFVPKSPSDKLNPKTLSVTSTRLLVTSHDTKELMQYDAEGNELRRIQLEADMKPEHAVESPSRTYIVSHEKTQLGQHQVSEVNADGKVLRHFGGSRLSSLGQSPYIAVDTHGNIFVAEHESRHILVLDAQLKFRRVVIDEHQLNYQPHRLCYREQSGLLVGFHLGAAVYDVLRH